MLRAPILRVRIQNGDRSLVFVEHRFRPRHQHAGRRRRRRIADAVNIFGADSELVALANIQIPDFAAGLRDVVVDHFPFLVWQFTHFNNV